MRLTLKLLPIAAVLIIRIPQHDADKASRLPLYAVTDLGKPSAHVWIPRRINAGGDIIGNSVSAFEDPVYAYYLHHKMLIGLGILGDSETRAEAINASAQVVGSSRIGGAMHAFVWQHGRIHRLDPSDGFSSSAYGINDRGDIVGSIASQQGSHAYLWSHGKHRMLTFSGGQMGSASAINNRGEIVGVGHLDKYRDQTHAVLFSKGHLRDLGTLPGRNSSIATGINDHGQVIGRAYQNTFAETVSKVPSRGFLWDQGKMIDLAPLPGFDMSNAEDINDAGQVVGYVAVLDKITESDNSAEGNEPDAPSQVNLRAFTFIDGRMVDLNGLIPRGSGWVLSNANGINKQGQIVGVGRHNGKFRAFLLTPISR